MAQIGLSTEAQALKFPISTDKFEIYRRNGKHFVRAKVHVDISNYQEFMDSIFLEIRERIAKMNSEKLKK